MLTGLSNLLADYPTEQARAAGMSSERFTTLLRTYARSLTRSHAVNGSKPWVGENIEPDKGYWIARDILYKGGTIDDHGRSTALPANCSACKGRCYDRDWSSDGRKCINPGLPPNSTLGPCDFGCPCVPPEASYDRFTHGPPACCSWGEPFGSCDGKVMPSRDKDRGKDYNHATFVDNVIEGLVGVRASLDSTLVVQPSADSSLRYWALDSLLYHGHNVSVVYDQTGETWPLVGCVGLCVYLDGKLAAHSTTLERLEIQLPQRYGPVWPFPSPHATRTALPAYSGSLTTTRATLWQVLK